MKAIIAALVLLAPGLATADKSLDKDGVWDCAKDPVVVIANGDGAYTFKGTCKKIVVAGGENKLTVESVDILEVAGAENKIDVNTVGTIIVGGADNKITWKKAATGTSPKIKGQPDKNKISQVK